MKREENRKKNLIVGNKIGFHQHCSNIEQFKRNISIKYHLKTSNLGEAMFAFEEIIFYKD